MPKLLILILLGGLAGIPVAGQISQKVTLSGKNIALEKILKEIERQTSVTFMQNDAILKKARPVDIKVTNITVEEALEILFREQPNLQYGIYGSTVVVKISRINAPAVLQTVSGRVMNEKGEPLPGATIIKKGSAESISTNDSGEFVISSLSGIDELVITRVDFEPKTVQVRKDQNNYITLQQRELPVVTVLFNGYQSSMPWQRTGAASVVHPKLLNRRVSGNILDRIENVSAAVSFKNPVDGILIRGRNSFFSNVNPLIVIDHFPYDGDINNINPNDIESVAILKDAAAASAWGARSGNGVIVIKTKSARPGKPKIYFNSNFTYAARPDLSHISSMSAADYIGLEKFLYEQGYYNAALANLPGNHRPLTPAVELLEAVKNGSITAAEAETHINRYKTIDARNELEKYFYRNALGRQHFISVNGGSQNANYYFSAGLDQAEPELAGARSDRITLRSKNTWEVGKKLLLEAAASWVQAVRRFGDNPGYALSNGNSLLLYPYADLADASGRGLEIVREYRGQFTDTAGGGRVLNWKYNPLNDIATLHGRHKVTDHMLNLGARYRIAKGLHAEMRYQYENQLSIVNTDWTKDSWFARNLVNTFYQPGGPVHFPIPIGGIDDITNERIFSHQGRLQLLFNRRFHTKHELNTSAGFEIKDLRTKGNRDRLYGVGTINPIIDYSTEYPQFQWADRRKAKIPNPKDDWGYRERFISLYSTATYSFDSTYVVTGSVRNDATNLFGTKSNQRGDPTWSAGISWQIDRERFYNLHWLPSLKLRLTYGWNGNFTRITPPRTTISYGLNSLGNNAAFINNPPNENLSWERVRMLNLGLDFASKNNRIAGSLDLYFKKNSDLVAKAPIDPTSGQTPRFGGPAFVYSNVAGAVGNGFEMELRTINVNGRFTWSSLLFFNYAITKVSKYLMPVSRSPETYLGSNGTVTPIIGKPVYSVYSFAWAGLDPNNGDPIGYLGNSTSTDYNAIYHRTNIDSLVYHGPVQPPVFGAIMNDFEFRNFSFSFNISYKFGHYFRKKPVSYSEIAATWNGSGDYSNRWQRPGDEARTQVPSFVYPFRVDREIFYANAQPLVEKADQVRLEDIRVSYTIDRPSGGGLMIYVYLSNLGTLWTANNSGIDPYFINMPKPRKSIAVGVTMHF